MSGQLLLFSAADIPIDRSKLDKNPMVRSWGFGPSGATCRGCKFIRAKKLWRKTYYKCAMHGDTNGPGTDHRLKWSACSIFEPREDGSECENIRRQR